MFISNNRPSFHLRWTKNLVKHQKVSIYYEKPGRKFDVFEYQAFSDPKLCVLGCLKEYIQRKNGRVDKGQKLFITYYHIVVVQQRKQSIWALIFWMYWGKFTGARLKHFFNIIKRKSFVRNELISIKSWNIEH